ncbi:unnamed protein product [Lampetra fluviatilis]
MGSLPRSIGIFSVEGINGGNSYHDIRTSFNFGCHNRASSTTVNNSNTDNNRHDNCSILNLDTYTCCLNINSRHYHGRCIEYNRDASDNTRCCYNDNIFTSNCDNNSRDKTKLNCCNNDTNINDTFDNNSSSNGDDCTNNNYHASLINNYSITQNIRTKHNSSFNINSTNFITSSITGSHNCRTNYNKYLNISATNIIVISTNNTRTNHIRCLNISSTNILRSHITIPHNRCHNYRGNNSSLNFDSNNNFTSITTITHNRIHNNCRSNNFRINGGNSYHDIRTSFNFGCHNRASSTTVNNSNTDNNRHDNCSILNLDTYTCCLNINSRHYHGRCIEYNRDASDNTRCCYNDNIFTSNCDNNSRDKTKLNCCNNDTNINDTFDNNSSSNGDDCTNNNYHASLINNYSITQNIRTKHNSSFNINSTNFITSSITGSHNCRTNYNKYLNISATNIIVISTNNTRTNHIRCLNISSTNILRSHITIPHNRCHNYRGNNSSLNFDSNNNFTSITTITHNRIHNNCRSNNFRYLNISATNIIIISTDNTSTNHECSHFYRTNIRKTNSNFYITTI